MRIVYILPLLHAGRKHSFTHPPFPQIDIIRAMMIVWRARGKLSGLFCAVLYATIVHSELHTHEQT